MMGKRGLRRIRGIAAIGMLLMLSMTACKEKDGEETLAGSSDESLHKEEISEKQEGEKEESQRPLVTVVSGGETYIPIEDFNFEEGLVLDPSTGEEQIVSVNGGYLQAQNVWGMPNVPYYPKMTIQSAKEPSSVVYRLWDENRQELDGGMKEVPSLDQIRLPVPEENYMVEIRLQFKEGASTYGCQYFFQVTAKAPSPDLQISCQREDGRVEVPTEKGIGAFGFLTQENRLVSLPIGSVLQLSFSEDVSISEIRVYNIILNNSDYMGEMLLMDMGEEYELLDLESKSFYLKTDLEAMAAGGGAIYQSGGVIRGLVFQCFLEDGGEECYSAAVRTDVAFGQEEGDVSSAYLEE